MGLWNEWQKFLKNYFTLKAICINNHIKFSDRNAMLLLLYASFNKIRDFPKLLKNNDNSISPSLFLEFLAPILVNTLMKNLIGTGIHEFLHQTIYKIH